MPSVPQQPQRWNSNQQPQGHIVDGFLRHAPPPLVSIDLQGPEQQRSAPARPHSFQGYFPPVEGNDQQVDRGYERTYTSYNSWEKRS